VNTFDFFQSHSAMRSQFCLALLSVPVVAHDDGLPINPMLGVPGFPDCVRAHPEADLDVAEAADDLVCNQKKASNDAIRIGMIGDSITAGVCSSGGNHPYPQQLQILLDQAYGEGVYSVTNMGACGSTMLKGGDSPFWKRRQYTTLTSNKWDIITIMLGTNDAKDPGSHGPDNWHHDCSDDKGAHTAGCQFASDYKDMIDLVRTLGTTDGVEPKVYGMIPPPLMQENSYGMNRTVINTVYPKLVQLISSDNKLTGTIDLFTGMGGVEGWESQFPDSCQKDSPWKPCSWWCDDQHCDQCHPNDSGYAHLATVVQAGLGLTGPTITV
jgi:lysophospholipase L1-like esterase